ncbi:ABC transporter permease [Paenisporosarcina quisquiliarum]|uniref:Putative hemin transport system permease protein HrtB n=1 Tax=Paenisporosarcina quisquiliarum TaxID=365346 RepID=A0A9X3LI31_9BACL|nr:ABC transporter permease [Paenisporosarcina quisquiliarum]MCZ8538316.1 ABC transporter permease [Paenisporosarcina quisquiliarum]
MFLAWNEIKKNKLRFLLITGVLMLVSYLVFFLSGLASGLENLNREAVDKWQGDGIVLTSESDKSMPQSSMTLDQLDDIEADNVAVLGQLNAIATSGDIKANVAIFGIEKDEFIMPDVTEGEAFNGENEVIASDSLKEEGFQIGDELELSSTDEKLTIVGFTEDARFNAAPVLYGEMATFHRVKFGEAAEQNDDQINGVVLRTNDLKSVTDNEDLETIEMEEFIQNLPGYTEQNLTLSFMIYFLFVISSVIVAIFLYVLTVQKISLFGVMKAQGISNGYLSRSVIAQTFILAAVGVAVGFGLTLLTGAFLPAAVPVSFDIPTMLLYGLVLIVVAILGAVFSVLTIVKIDPLKAIGG